MIAAHGAQQGAGSAQLLDSNEKLQSGSAALWSRINVLLSMGPRSTAANSGVCVVAQKLCTKRIDEWMGKKKIIQGRRIDSG